MKVKPSFVDELAGWGSLRKCKSGHLVNLWDYNSNLGYCYDCLSTGRWLRVEAERKKIKVPGLRR